MKKLLILPLAFASTVVIAQQPHLSTPLAQKNSRFHVSSSRITNQSTAAISIYSQDFNGGLPAGWSITDNAGNGEVWTWTNSGANGGAYLNPVGTSAVNGYMMFDSDGGGSGSGAEDCDLTSSAINCSGQSQVYLSFNEYYEEYELDSSLLQISTDSVIWTSIYCPDTSLANYEATNNPEVIILDISTFAANQPTVYLRWKYVGDWDWYWFIDDVELYVPNATDALAYYVDPLSAEYTQLPLAQAMALSLYGEIRNVGGTSISGATAQFDVIDTVSNTVVFTTTTPLSSLAPLALTGVTGTNPFTAATPGYYRTKLTVIVSGDGDTTNNKLADWMVTQVTDSVMARDNGIETGQLGIGAGPAQGIMGQNFTLDYTDVLTSVSFFLDSNMSHHVNPAGTPIWVTIHDQNSSVEPAAIPIASTDTLMATPGFVNGFPGTWFTLPISGGPLWLNAGSYFLGVHENDSLVMLATCDEIWSPATVWVSWNSIPSPPANNGWATADDFGFYVAYMLRANFGPNINNVNNNEPAISTFDLFPNPAMDEFTLNFPNTTERRIDVLNSLGQVVSSSLSSLPRTTLHVNTLSPGTYFVRVTENNSVSVKRICIQR